MNDVLIAGVLDERTPGEPRRIRPTIEHLTPPPIVIVEQIAGLDRDLEEFELRLVERHHELEQAADRCKALIERVRQARGATS